MVTLKIGAVLFISLFLGACVPAWKTNYIPLDGSANIKIVDKRPNMERVTNNLNAFGKEYPAILYGESGFNPGGFSTLMWFFFKRTLFRYQRFHFGIQTFQAFLVKACTAIANVFYGVALVYAQYKRPEMLARAARVGPTANHEFLAIHTFDLDPAARPS